MLFTRTIRRKVICWIALLALVFGGLIWNSVRGLASYRRTVEDLDLSIRSAPRNAELVAAISSLLRPFTVPQPTEPSAAQRAARLQSAQFDRELQSLHEHIADYKQRFDSLESLLGHSLQARPICDSLLVAVDEKLLVLQLEIDELQTAATPAPHQQQILEILGELIEAVESMPDPSLELTGRLREAEGDYAWHTRMVWLSGSGSVVLFLLLVLCSYRWVIAPLNNLHQGALRVASGNDFDFRLPVGSQDELAELAHAFNQMTARFQQVTEDLDAQVQQRSRQLVQSERLAGVGFLSAGVAHEINNPLSAIVGAADSLEWRLSEQLDKFSPADATVIREYLHMMQNEAQRCRRITEKLLNFARGQQSERGLYDVTAIVREVIAMTQHLGRFVDRQVVFDREDPCYAWVNGDEIKQVVLNLVANALDATSAGGRVTIGIRDCSRQAEISVTDDGEGMTTDVLEHIFEPFYTRKEVGKGTGLGLSISHRIVQDHGGSLEATSPGPGQGSTFRLRVPAAPETTQRAA